VRRVFAAGVRNHELPLFNDFLVFDHTAFGENDPLGFASEQTLDNEKVPVRIFGGYCTHLFEKSTQSPFKKLIIGKAPYRYLYQFMNMIWKEKGFDPGKMIHYKYYGTFGDVLLFVNPYVCL